MKRSKNEDKTFLEHLEELRWRALISIAAVIVGTALSYVFVNQLLRFFSLPIIALDVVLVALAPAEKFVSLLEIALLAGLLGALPVLLYQFWRFISPGLKEKERRHIRLLFFLAPFFFILGGAFAFFFLVPFALRFFLGVAPQIKATISLSRYISFVVGMLFSVGLVFELPLAILGLTKMGLVTPQMLRQKRRIVIVGIFIAAAVLTPGPDVFSQLLMAIPMFLLYEVSILGSSLLQNRAKICLDNDNRL